MVQNNLFLLFAENFLNEQHFEPLISDNNTNSHFSWLLFSLAIKEGLSCVINNNIQLTQRKLEDLSDIFFPEFLIEIYKHDNIPHTEKSHIISYCRTLPGFNEYLNRIEDITRDHHGYKTYAICRRLVKEYNVESINDLYTEWLSEYEKMLLVSQSIQYPQNLKKRI